MSDPRLTLFFAPRTRSFSAVWLLEELGVNYRLESFSLAGGDHKSPEFLSKNPMGKVPVVMDGDIPVSELGAIAIYLNDTFADATLQVAQSSSDRPAFLRWIFFASAIMEPAFAEHLFKWNLPSRSMAWGSHQHMVDVLTGRLATSETLAGDRFSLADVYVGAQARFGLLFGAIEKGGAIDEWVTRLQERPAFQRAAAIEAREGERFPPPPRD